MPPTTAVPVISVTALDTEASVARRMIAEAAIAANEAVATFGAARGLPLPYRGQPAPVEAADSGGDDEDAAYGGATVPVPHGLCAAAALRSTMARSTLSTDAPARHAGLGLAAYTQATSPIRRYADLVAHWQVKAVLRGEEPPWGDACALSAHGHLRLCGRTRTRGRRARRHGALVGPLLR